MSRTWATEGHSVPLPGLGTMRFGVRSKAVENLEDVKTGLISVRRIIFTPNTEVKEELKNSNTSGGGNTGGGGGDDDDVTYD